VYVSLDLQRTYTYVILWDMTAAYDPHHDWTLEDDDVNEDEA
jgi:hypothetical protein